MNKVYKINNEVSVKQLLASNSAELAPLTRRLERIAKKRGFKSYHGYNRHYLSKQGLVSELEHQKRLAEKMGLSTATEYINKKKNSRAQNPEYIKLANLINARLLELDIRKSTLARLAGIPRNIISQYAKGYSYPKPKRLVKILEALQVYHHSPLIGDSHVLGKHAVLQKPKHPKYSELSNLINNTLAKYGKDKKWLAKASKITREHISTYINGQVYPSPERLERIKKALNSLSLK
jgi:transcriptional regulator with XRE-family HTH domain